MQKRYLVKKINTCPTTIIEFTIPEKLSTDLKK